MRPIRVLGKTIGFLKEDRVFVAKRDARMHVMYKPDGLALSVSALAELRRRMCWRIVFLLDYGDRVEKLVTTPERMLEWGTRIVHRLGDWQAVLPLEFFNLETLGGL